LGTPGPLEPSPLQAAAVNILGDVCGLSGRMPFVAPASQSDQPPAAPRNAQWGNATDINNLGEIVGQLDTYKTKGYSGAPGDDHPYLWKNGDVSDLEKQIVSAEVQVQSRHDTKAEPDLLEMSIAGEDVRDRQILHHNHRREVHERDARFVVIPLPQLPGAAELVGGNVDQPIPTRVKGRKHRLDVSLGLAEINGGEQSRDQFRNTKSLVTYCWFSC
jgi:hypothetical protein